MRLALPLGKLGQSWAKLGNWALQSRDKVPGSSSFIAIPPIFRWDPRTPTGALAIVVSYIGLHYFEPLYEPQAWVRIGCLDLMVQRCNLDLPPLLLISSVSTKFSNTIDNYRPAQYFDFVPSANIRLPIPQADSNSRGGIFLPFMNSTRCARHWAISDSNQARLTVETIVLSSEHMSPTYGS